MSAEWDDLARLAEAATEGPWEAYGTTVAAMTGPGDCRGCSGLVSPEHEPACYWSEIAGAGEADAEFIAAANPATILRLIDERDALAARLAAVEALTLRRDGNVRLPGAVIRVGELRAALSAAPTDTTKETGR